MTQESSKKIWAAVLVSIILLAGAASLKSKAWSLGIALGGAWHVASFWLLLKVLRTWMNPHRSTVKLAGWLALKIIWLGIAGFGLLRLTPAVIVGFVVGFTAVLVIMVAATARQRLVHPKRVAVQGR